MIIAVSGKLGSGKDTVGQIIQYLIWKKRVEAGLSPLSGISFSDFGNKPLAERYSGWEIKKYASNLKIIASILTGIPVEKFEDQEFKKTYLPEIWDYNTEFEGGTVRARMTIREFLQRLGTDAMRNGLHPSTWSNAFWKDYRGDIEEWKDIEEFPGEYQISNFGRVRGLARISTYGEGKGEYHSVKERILTPSIQRKYYVIKLKHTSNVLIHSLVGKYFVPNLDNLPILNHRDQDPLNNFYKNLEWTTQSENIKQANLYGNGNIGEKQSDAKLTEEAVLDIKNLLKTNMLQRAIAEKHGVSNTTISDIKHGRKWMHVGRGQKKIAPIVPIPTPNWCITDIRFPNELEAAKERNAITIRVERPMGSSKFEGTQEEWEILVQRNKQTPHPSETSLDHITDWDYVIHNCGTIDELIKKVEIILLTERIL